MSDHHDSAAAQSATTPLLAESGAADAAASPKKSPKKSATETQVVITTVTTSPGSPIKVATERPLSAAPQSGPASPAAAPAAAAGPTDEYKFVQLHIPTKEGKLKFLLPILLLVFQVLFIVLFAVFASYKKSPDTSKYPLYIDLHAIALIGFGFLMTFLKRFGYGSLGFSLVLVAFVIQWALIIRGWVEINDGYPPIKAYFDIGLENLVMADYTAVAVLVSVGALIGKTTLTQLVVLALIEVVIQVFNEYINVQLIYTYDVGRSIYVHLFGAVFGLAAAKFLHCSGVKSRKQSAVYHSDLFALIGTLFLFVYYPSFNSILVKNNDRQAKAVVNTVAAIAASCVVTFGVSSLAGKGKLSVLHIQHATIAGGIAIGSVADLNVQIYVALIVGAAAGLLSTIGYKYIDPLLNKVLKLHDTCSVQSLHIIPGLIAGLVSAIFAITSTQGEYGDELHRIYVARTPASETMPNGDAGFERSGAIQAAFQLAGVGITLGVAVVFGGLTGLFLRLPIFEQLDKEVEMFDDEAQWITPDDYAIKLTVVPSHLKQQTEEKHDDTKV